MRLKDYKKQARKSTTQRKVSAMDKALLPNDNQPEERVCEIEACLSAMKPPRAAPCAMPVQVNFHLGTFRSLDQVYKAARQRFAREKLSDSAYSRITLWIHEHQEGRLLTGENGETEFVPAQCRWRELPFAALEIPEFAMSA